MYILLEKKYKRKEEKKEPQQIQGIHHVNLQEKGDCLTCVGPIGDSIM